VLSEGTAIASTRPRLGCELDWEHFTYSKEL